MLSGARRSVPQRLALILIAVLALAAAAFALTSRQQEPDATPGPARVIGLFTTLPLLWNESGDIAGLLRSDAPPHWAMAVLERHGRVAALDILTASGTSGGLADVDLLVMAQPRALSPDENVALDDWVKEGGHVLLLVDPMLTGETLFSPGDPRRPQDMAMLSPILARWGLRLLFDEAQPGDERTVEVLGESLPVHLAGHFQLSGTASCRLEAGGLVARCRPGRGSVLAIADAALLESGRGDDGSAAPAALDALLVAAR